jgi:hypothetical protein
MAEDDGDEKSITTPRKRGRAKSGRERRDQNAIETPELYRSKTPEEREEVRKRSEQALAEAEARQERRASP